MNDLISSSNRSYVAFLARNSDFVSTKFISRTPNRLLRGSPSDPVSEASRAASATTGLYAAPAATRRRCRTGPGSPGSLRRPRSLRQGGSCPDRWHRTAGHSLHCPPSPSFHTAGAPVRHSAPGPGRSHIRPAFSPLATAHSLYTAAAVRFPCASPLHCRVTADNAKGSTLRPARVSPGCATLWLCASDVTF